MKPESGQSALLKHLLTLEQEMHRTEVRRNRQRMEELLHPDFEEFGRSGRVYSREEILAEFSNEGSLPTIAVSDIELKPLSDDLALLSYVSCHQSTSDQRRTRRSSLWQKNGERWQVRFHQGTAIEDAG